MINDLLLAEIRTKVKDIEGLTLKGFLDAGFQSVEDCSLDTGIRIPTLYHVWKGLRRPSRANEKLLRAYTRNLVNWDHL